MALSNSRRFGGIFLIVLGFVFIISGFTVMLFNTTFIIDLASVFFTNLPTALFLMGLIHVILGIFFIWAGRMVRNEPFLPKFIKKMM